MWKLCLLPFKITRYATGKSVTIFGSLKIGWFTHRSLDLARKF